ncbi:MAG: hypothetical protein P0Y55_12870 [Candidatus Cohnella colombiensis]|uniref:Uncharacterized protein n=1 Tax=Candidatus Cohnella colombiensis TaxID=3121368 RepID=A0AA95JF84_9BACL|nr:MAG: hypothetical protein P0Y55_12870 [Cohnella sp.]
MLVIDNIVEFIIDLFIWDKLAAKNKKKRLDRIINSLLKKHSWFAGWCSDPLIIETIVNDETISDLLISKEYRKELEENEKIKKVFKELVEGKIRDKNFGVKAPKK